MACDNPQADPQIKELLIKTHDFLEPLSNRDLACTFGLCDQIKEPHICAKKVWKCKKGSEFVSLNSFEDAAIQEARENCAVLDDTHFEPSSGQGAIVVHPIRDDFLPSRLYHAKTKRTHKREHHMVLLVLLMIALVVVIFLLMKK